MIFMAIQTVQEANATSLAEIFVYVATVSPVFIPMMLFSIFCVIALGTYFSPLRTTGRADFSASFAVAGWFTALIAASTLGIISNLVNIVTLIVAISVSVIATIIFLYSDRV